MLLAVDAAAAGPALTWEPARGGALFPHLYRPLTLADLLWSRRWPTARRGRSRRSGWNEFGERIALPLLRLIDPETAHGLAVAAVRAGLGPRPARSRRRACAPGWPASTNPLGLAAGLDKNATAVAAGRPARLRRGRRGDAAAAARQPAPAPVPGRDRAAINRFGFNNDGAAAIAARLALRPEGGIVGLNLGANKDSADRAADFAEVLALAGPFVDFATVNVSSPNTERLRELQGRAALAGLLAGVSGERAAGPAGAGAAQVATAASCTEDGRVGSREGGVAGIVATNTTLARDGLSGRHAAEAGGCRGSRCSPARPWCWPAARDDRRAVAAGRRRRVGRRKV